MDPVQSSTCLKDISLLKSEPKNQQHACCKSSCHIRRLNNRGALLILLWSFLAAGVFKFSEIQNRGLVFNIQLVVGGLTLPIAGWLADIYFGRYKIINWSMWTMWVAFILATASSVVAQFVDAYNNISSYVNGVLMAIGAIGFGGFQANIIQIGIDQLHDASTSEVTSFIAWYVWCTCSSQFAVDSVIKILYCARRVSQLFGTLVVCVQLSISLTLTQLFNYWLIKEPVTQNPFKLVYYVIRYAIKHKQPRCRSAFTYCEDELPSRIDFGKSKYGGSFTTEQVEDVKTFLRLLVFVFVMSILLGILTAVYMLKVQLSNQLVTRRHISGRVVSNKCYSEKLTQQIFNYSWVIVIPLYEFVIYPLFSRCLAAISSRIKFAFGLLLQIAAIVALIPLVVVARHRYLKYNTSNQNNATIQCIFYEGDGALSSSLDSQWMSIPNLLFSFSIIALSIGALEFFVSQTPYSMRGLLVGSTYGMVSLFAALTVAISIPFTKISSLWGTGIISCGFWYAVLLLIAEVMVGIALVVALKFYKKRKREDVLPNEHIFAERYYAKDS